MSLAEATVGQLLIPVDDFERGVAYRWGAEPWSRGAFAVCRPGQMTTLVPDLPRSEGRVHFAGEHTSSWVGWMEGAMEFGPRALGHRSILAAPHEAAMRDRLNREIKYREQFRPFAPVVPRRVEVPVEPGRDFSRDG